MITESLRATVPWLRKTAQASHSVLSSTSMLPEQEQELHGPSQALSSLKNIKPCMVSVIEMIARYAPLKLSHSTTNHIKRPISGKLLPTK